MPILISKLISILNFIYFFINHCSLLIPIYSGIYCQMICYLIWSWYLFILGIINESILNTISHSVPWRHGDFFLSLHLKNFHNCWPVSLIYYSITSHFTTAYVFGLILFKFCLMASLNTTWLWASWSEKSQLAFLLSSESPTVQSQYLVIEDASWMGIGWLLLLSTTRTLWFGWEAQWNTALCVFFVFFLCVFFFWGKIYMT